MTKIFNFFLVFLIISSCGFKIVNRSEIPNYYISKIYTTGDKKINYIIRNNFKENVNDRSKQPLDLYIETNKTKKIKEKNIKNEITKQMIIIDVKIRFEKSNNIASEIFISKSGEYNVGNQYSQTLTDEKKLIKILSDDISEEILLKIKENTQ
jgi:hypothetical protein